MPSEREIRRKVIVAVFLSIVAAAACSSSPAGAGREMSCVGPRLSVTPAQVSPGQEVHAHGEWFSATCDDVISPGGQPAASSPLTGLIMQVSQQGHTWSVASGLAASGEHNTFDAVIRLPSELASGTAEVAVSGYGAPVTVTVTAH